MALYLLADIGGTNARFSLVTPDQKTEARTKIYKVRENPTLIGTVKLFLKEFLQESEEVTAAAFAIAGPVLGTRVELTNSDWVCDKQELTSFLSIDNVFLLNDFEAVSWAITDLKAADYSVLQKGVPNESRPALVMGPGTGLGVAAMIREENGNVRALTTEAGHVRYAPANERERNMIRILSREFNFVSAEHLVSGPGLVNIYRANCALTNTPYVPCKPAEIVERARDGNQLYRQALDDFAAIFGSFASQLALSWISLGGLYLTGGVVEKLGEDFDRDRFMGRFATNPKMAHLLAQVPVHCIQAEIPAFSGLHCFLRQRATLTL